MLSFATQPQAVLGAPLCPALAHPGRIKALKSWLLGRNIWGCMHHRHPLEIKGELSWLAKGGVYVCESLRCAAPWTVAHQAPLSMGFSRQEYCSGLPLPSPEGLPNPEIEPGSLYCRWILYHLSPQGSQMKGYLSFFLLSFLSPRFQRQTSRRKESKFLQDSSASLIPAALDS